MFYDTGCGLETSLPSAELELGCGCASSSASWGHLPGTWGHLLPRVLGQGVSPTHSAGLGLGTKPSSSHQQQAWGEGGFGSCLIQGGCCTTLRLSRGSCCVSHPCCRLPDLTHGALGWGLGSWGFRGSRLTPGPAEAGCADYPPTLAS